MKAIILGKSAATLVAWHEQGPVVSDAQRSIAPIGRLHYDASRFRELGFSDTEIEEIGFALLGAGGRKRR
jgi:hypothetical protein